MRKLWRKRWVRVLAYTLTTVLLLLLGFCWYLRIWRPEDVIAYYCLTRKVEGFNPVWKDLALRRFGKGDDVRALGSRHPPYSVEPIGPYAMLDYVDRSEEGLHFNNLYVVARDGRLLFAHAISCTWDHVLFGDRRDVEAFMIQYQNHLEAKLQEQAEVR